MARFAFIGQGGRCTATGFLEYHHVVPFAAGGETSVKNLELRCRAHNQYEADRYFGPLLVPLVREARAVYGVIANSFRNARYTEVGASDRSGFRSSAQDFTQPVADVVSSVSHARSQQHERTELSSF
jgi:hypothetical protein